MTYFASSCYILKQAHLNLDEYNEEDYVNFDMIDKTLWVKFKAWTSAERTNEQMPSSANSQTLFFSFSCSSCFSQSCLSWFTSCPQHWGEKETQKCSNNYDDLACVLDEF